MTAELQEYEGLCLIASPRLNGGPFRKSIVLITHHETGGTMGVIFNEPTQRRLGDFLKNLSPGLAEAPIYDGGPVEKSVLTLVGLEHKGNKLEIRSHLTPEMAREFLEERKDGAHIRAYLGYSGWAAGQLEEEIMNGDWRLMPFTPALIEPMPQEKLWEWANAQVR